MRRNPIIYLAAVLAAALPVRADLRPAERPVPDQYVVVLEEGVARRPHAGPATGPTVAEVAQQMAVAFQGEVFAVYDYALQGYAMRMSAQRARQLARDRRVAWVEEDGVVELVGTQTGATWGLDRVDQRDLPLDGTYEYETTAANVHAYVIDTGLRSTHVEFSGRVGAGFTSINDGRGTGDCNGHGTHVAGTVGGSTWGVAKQPTVHPVRVLNCQGSGTTSGVISGVDWVTANFVAPAVANMSLGGGASSSLDQAVRNSVAAGVTYAVAAGNSNADACNSSPSRVAEALTVGSTTSSDARSSFSNWGTCVDLFAPGSSITSAWSTSDTATNTISGTSMASPHVAGVAALYLAGNPAASPSQVMDAVLANATAGRLSGVGSGSPNLLAYSLFGGGGGPVDDPPSAAFSFTCNGLVCDFDASASTDDNGIDAYDWDFGDGAGGTGVTTSHTYAAAGTYGVTLTVTDTAGQTDADTQSVSVSDGGAPCVDCEHYTGTLSGTGDYDYQPNGTYYYSAVSGVHRGWLSGPASADFDLRLYKWNWFWGWLQVASSLSADSEEEIAYSGSSGYYLWRIESYSGSGGYDFWLDRP